MVGRKILLATVVALAAMVAGIPLASPAWAAPPSNDEPGGAVVVGPVPFHYEEDTTEATTSADEAALNAFCGAPVLEQGVWFTATATESGAFTVDTTESNYSAGILALAGTPGNFVPLACGPGQIAGEVNAGDTVYLLIFGDGLSGTTSGHLVLNIDRAVAPPTIDVTVDPTASVNKDGIAHLTGTVRCTTENGEGSVIDVFGQLRQRIGRVFINGFFDSFVGTPCDGTAYPWSADVVGDNGLFSGGKAATVTIAFGCGTSFCNEGFVEASVKLRHNGK
jgi:hypothetical protein